MLKALEAVGRLIVLLCVAALQQQQVKGTNSSMLKALQAVVD